MIPAASDVGVLVGRFQVHRLHEAHLALIRSVYDTHPQTVIVLGLSPARVTHRNPLDFEARKQMLLDAFPKATIFYLHDQPSDDIWSDKLDALIDGYLSPRQSVRLYGGRDSFITRYHGKYETQALDSPVYVSGTELRQSITRSVKASEDFRAGVIWASANGYPRVYPAVDVAICQDVAGQRLHDWLMVRKPNEKQWRFPGGFVLPTDRSYEDAAKREAMEETGAEIGRLEYVGSFLVDDWRYRQETDKILTTLFKAAYVFGPIRPADDVAEARWSNQIDVADIVPEHHPLVNALIRSAAHA